MSKQKIGFIGLGVMGASMAKNLLKAGYELTVCDLNPDAVKVLQDKGAAVADNLEVLAGSSDVIWTMLPDGPDVEKVCLGENGVFAGAREGLIVIDSSTIDPSVSQKIAGEASKIEVNFLDAPVGGSPTSAREGTLVMLVGGEASTLEACRDMLAVVGEATIHAGPVGAGEKLKLANNLMTMIFNSMLIEGFTLAKMAGINQQDLLDLMEINIPKILPRIVKAIMNNNLELGFRTALAHKDLRLALKMGEDYNVPLPFGSLSKQIFQMVITQGKGHLNTQSPRMFYEKLESIP